MISKASTRFIRMSPRKARLVADLVRGKSIASAQDTLFNTGKKAASYIMQTLKSAIANAKKSPEIAEADLYVSKITVDGGPMFKRYRAGSMGRAMMIRHRTSHILVELDLNKAAVKKAQVIEGQAKKTKTPVGKKEAKVHKKEIKPKAKKAAAGGKGK